MVARLRLPCHVPQVVHCKVRGAVDLHSDSRLSAGPQRDVDGEEAVCCDVLVHWFRAHRLHTKVVEELKN